MKTKMEEILYAYGDGALYVNLTNKCPCRCTFCIRSSGDGLGTAQSLWLEHEPDIDEVKAAFAGFKLEDYKELVFCGYGEPTCALDTLLETCRYVRSISKIPIRINTNGLSDLINKRPTASLLKGLVDTVSISLNAPDKDEYLRVTRPGFGDCSFEAMQDFALECKSNGISAIFTVVDVLSPEDIEKSKKLADKLGIPLRVRTYYTANDSGK